MCYRGVRTEAVALSLALRRPVSGRVVGLVVRCGSCRGGTRRRALGERGPVQIRSGFGRDHALVEQEDLGEVVAEAGSGLLVRAGDDSRCADGDSGGLGQLGDGRVDSVADDVVAAGLGVSRARRKKSARSAAWTVAQCCRPVPSMIRLPASSRGELRSTPGTPPPPSPETTPETITTPRMSSASTTRRSICSLHATNGGAL